MPLNIFNKSLIPLLLSTLCIMLLGSCSNDPIFAFLELEEKVVDRNLDNDLTITAIADDDNYLYTSGLRIYRRAKNQVSWSTLPLPSSAQSCYDLAANSTLLAGAFILDNGTHQVFTSLDSGDNWSSVSLSGDQFFLFKGQSEVYISPRQGSSHSLYTSADSFSAAIGAISLSSNQPAALFYDGTGDVLCHGSKIERLDGTEITSLSEGTFIDACFFDGGYFALTSKGIVAAPQWENPFENPENPILYCIAPGGNSLFAGTYLTGLRVVSQDPITEPSSGNYSVTVLRDSTITHLYRTQEGHLLAGTNQEGLWYLSDDDIWSRE